MIAYTVRSPNDRMVVTVCETVVVALALAEMDLARDWPPVSMVDRKRHWDIANRKNTSDQRSLLRTLTLSPGQCSPDAPSPHKRQLLSLNSPQRDERGALRCGDTR
jgi:hypothetical protein